MTLIHPTALVDSRAELGRNVVIGPFCQAEAGAILGDDCRLETGAIIRARTTLGCDNHVGEGAVLGDRAQQLEAPEPGGMLAIGNHNRIREHVTIHRGWANDVPRPGSSTDRRGVPIRSASEPNVGNIRTGLEDLLSAGKEAHSGFTPRIADRTSGPGGLVHG